METMLTFTAREHFFGGIGIFLLGAVFLFFLFRYGRFICKRIILFVKLKKMCKALKATLIGTSFFWIFGRRTDIPCDFYIETESIIYAVKLFGVAGRRSRLLFTSDRKYIIHNRRLPDIGPHPLPEYKFRYKFRTEWELKTPCKVLLLHPVCTAVLREEINRKYSRLNPREQIFGMEVHTLSTLIQKIGEV